MKQTALDYLIEQLGEYFPHEIGGIHYLVKTAKKMEAEQMGWNNISSKEISDEEYYKNVFYQKQVMNPYSTGEQSYTAYEKGFMDFAKWYREQFKN